MWLVPSACGNEEGTLFLLHSADKENVTCGFMIKVWGWFGAASSLSLSSFNHVAEIFHLFFLLAF